MSDTSSQSPLNQFSTPPSSLQEKTPEVGSSSGSMPETSGSESAPSGGAGQNISVELSYRLQMLEARLEEIQQEVDSVLPGIRQKSSALFGELEKGGLTSRLHELELAVASLAGPMLSQTDHDSHGILTKWFNRFQGVFAPAAAQSAAQPSAKPEEERNAVLGSPSPGPR